MFKNIMNIFFQEQKITHQLNRYSFYYIFFEKCYVFGVILPIKKSYLCLLYFSCTVKCSWPLTFATKYLLLEIFMSLLQPNTCS